MLRVSVRGLPCQLLAMALTMSSRSFVAAKMHVKVSTVSCATLWENTATFGLRSRGDALYVESQCSSAVVQNCFSPWRFHRCSSWFVASCPLFCSTADARGDSTGAVPGRGCLHARCVQTVLGYDSAENCGISAVAVLSWWSMSLFMQFIDGCGCPCVFAETAVLLLEVPQTQFIAGAGGLSSFRDGVSSRIDGDEGVGAHHTGDELN